MIQCGWLWLAGGLAAIAQDGPDAYRNYALQHPGNPAAGIPIFTKLACTQCHTTDGSANRAGPDLSAIGSKFSREDLIRAVMEPSAGIAVGYDQTVLTRKDGSIVAGVIKQATADWIELMGADAKPVRVQTADIASRDTPAVSLMPQGLQAAATPAEFTDLMAYLASMRPAYADNDGDVPKARRQATLDSFFDDSIHFEEPVWFGEMPGRDKTYVVLEHRGVAWLVERKREGDVKTQLLDLTDIVRVGGATGLLSIAFHPKFPEDLRYFLKYQIVEEGKISTLLMERRFAVDLKGDSGEEPRQLLKIAATTQDHNGGCIAFGPDGYLYLGMGDTGPQRDPQGHAQDTSLLLGKMLRIDIDHHDEGLPYAIPKDNPFLHHDGVRPEIWALGFREPWRFSWDSATGDLWVGDVGQDRYEEVAIVRKGENHGWNVEEGTHAFSERYRPAGVKLTPPVWSYSHRIGLSVTGGFVYHGKQAPALRGWYICADHESRRIWALQQKDRKLQKVVEIGRAPSRAVSISQTRDGELQIAGFNSGKIYQLKLDTVDLAPREVRQIAATAEQATVNWRITMTRPDGDWNASDFDDSHWTEAPAGFGTEGTPGVVLRTAWNSADIWLRREIRLEKAPAADAQVSLRIHHDEDAEVYLNGTSIANLPHWTQDYTDVPLTAEAKALLHAGRNVMAIHCHQNGGGQYIDAGLVEEN